MVAMVIVDFVVSLPTRMVSFMSSTGCNF